MANRELTSLEELEDYTAKGYAVIDCYGDFCSACEMLKPVFENAAYDMAGIRFGEINVTGCAKVAEKYEIDALPTLLFFRDGKEVHRSIGSMDRETLNAEMSILLYGE